MESAWNTLAGKSIEWTGVHHSETGDFLEISSHVVSYEKEGTCYVTVDGELVGESRYTYKKLDDRMAILVYQPEQYQGRPDVILYAMLDFLEATDRAVILAGGKPFAIADGNIREVPTSPRPPRTSSARNGY